MTVLFTDLARSTDLRRSLGDDQADLLRRRHDEMIRAAAAEHLGEIVKGTGDGLMIVFPAAAQAVSGAVDIQRAIARLNRQLPEPLGVRVGVSAGDVVWEGSDCFGTPVVEAQRLCDAADEGRILVSEVVRLLAGSRGGHTLDAVGSIELKGLGEVAAYEVAWTSAMTVPHPLPPGLAASETLPLIGRRQAREAFDKAWKQAVTGVAQVVLIAGEPGVGKTRLASELARQVHADGATVLFGRCDEELAVPYQPFAEATAGYAAACNDEVLATQLGAGGGDIARLVPSLSARLPGLSEPLRADPETERYRLFEAVTHLLGAIAGEAPALLVLDDLHWAARPTLLLLRHVVRQRSANRLVILGTYRDTDLGRGHPLAEFLADLRREADVERLVLRGLSETEVVDLVATAAGHELDEVTVEFARRIHTETEGNPFFVGQVLRHLVETGAVRSEDGRWVVAEQRSFGIPEGVREVIGKRLSQLSTDANDVLSVAAVIGREFDSRLLTDASGLDADRVLDALEEAEASRLVLPVGGRDDRRTFAHALVRSTLYEEIPTTRRLRVHRRVAQALEARALTGTAPIEELAYHWCEAAALGGVDRAVHYSRIAAAAAFDRLAYEEAAHQYERALDVLDPEAPAHLGNVAELGVSRARALRAAGLHERSRQAAIAAVDAARRAGRPEVLADAALAIAGDRGWSEAGIVDTELVALLEEVLATLPEGDSSVRAMATARLASELYFLDDATERRAALTAEAVAMVERGDDDDAHAFVLECALWGAWMPGTESARVEQAIEVIELGRRSGNLVHQLTGHMWLLSSSAELGDGERFRASLDREVELAEALRRPEWLWVTTVHRAALALMETRYDDAATLLDEGLALGQSIGSETALQMYGVGHFGLGRARGGLDALVPLLQAMVEDYPLVPAWRCGLAFLYRELDRIDAAREPFEHFAVDDFRAIRRDANWRVGVSILASVASSLEDTRRAALLHELLRPYADSTITAGMPADVLGSMHGPLMLLTATMGRWDEAEAHYSASVVANERMGCRAWLIQTRYECAALLAKRGSRDQARAHAAACMEAAAASGMTRVAERASTLLDG